MVQHDLAHHHLHLRKRIYKKHEKYPHPNRLKSNLDRCIYVFATVMPILTFSQVFKIYSSKNAVGVSIIAWSAYFLGTVLWLIYGIIHREKPIIYTNIINGMINLLVVIGVILYG